MRRVGLLVGPVLAAGCITPAFELNQFAGGVVARGGGAPAAATTHTTVGAGVVPSEGFGGVLRVEASSGVDGLRGGDHWAHVMAGVGAQPESLTQRCGWEASAEFGTTTVGRLAWTNFEAGARLGLSIELAPRTLASRNRMYSLVLRRLAFLVGLRLGARVESDQAPSTAAFYFEGGFGLRVSLGSDLF